MRVPHVDGDALRNVLNQQPSELESLVVSRAPPSGRA